MIHLKCLPLKFKQLKPAEETGYPKFPMKSNPQAHRFWEYYSSLTDVLWGRVDQTLSNKGRWVRNMQTFVSSLIACQSLPGRSGFPGDTSWDRGLGDLGLFSKSWLGWDQEFNGLVSGIWTKYTDITHDVCESFNHRGIIYTHNEWCWCKELICFDLGFVKCWQSVHGRLW